MDIILYILAGAGVGLAVGVTGVGGGSLMTPLLIMFGFPYNVAIGTDLLYAALTKASGVVAHKRKGTIHWRLVALLAAGSIPASVITTLLLDIVFIDASGYEPLLTHSLGFMLIITSVVLLLKRYIGPRTEVQSEFKQAQPTPTRGNWSKSITLIAGVVLGICVTLSSVGAGAFCAALLMIIYPRLPALHIVGTDIAHAVPLTFIAGLGHLIFLGNVNFTLLACLLAGSLPAIHFGTHLATHLPNQWLQHVLASLLMMLGVKFAFF